MKMQKWELSSAGLHILAMGLMLCDHLWATVVPGNNWMNSIGRLAFPIFAFLIVEGYFHTGNLKKYALRLFAGALISELPFNLMVGSRLFFPIHQNVLWTFLLGLGLIHWNEKAAQAKPWRRTLRGISSVFIGMVAGTLTMADYYGAGVVTVLIFYFFRKRNWQNLLFQVLALYYVNVEMLAGLGFEVALFGRTVFITQQGFALFALIPIWLYQGRKGYSSKWFRFTCYGFYPVHMLILGMLKMM